MRGEKSRSRLLVLALPVFFMAVLMGVFALVWLRAHTTSMEYRIGRMEVQKVQSMSAKKSLVAEMASILSIQEVSKRGLELEFPDRLRVIYVKRDAGGVPYRTSLRRE